MLQEKFPQFAFTGLFSTIADIDYYAASFSAEGDLLPQWRAYCENGRGVAIGFDGPALLWTPGMFFRRVEYDRERQLSIATAIMSVYSAAIEKARGNDRELSVLVGELALFFVVLRGVFKHPAYAAEREYRLFNTLPKPRDAHTTTLHFRATRSAVIPYYEIQLQPEVGGRRTLTEIVIGPCLQPLVENSIRALLDQTGLAHVTVRHSNVQMRSD